MATNNTFGSDWTAFDPMASNMFGASQDPPSGTHVPPGPVPSSTVVVPPTADMKFFQKSPDKAVQEWFRSEFPRLRLHEELGTPALDVWKFISNSLIQRFDHANLRPAKQIALDTFRYSSGMSAESFVAELQHLCLDLDPRMTDDVIIEHSRGKLPPHIDSFAVTLFRSLPEFVKNIRGLLRNPAAEVNTRSRTVPSSTSQPPQLADNSLPSTIIQTCDYCNRNNHTWKQFRDFQRDVQQGYTDRLMGKFENRNRSRGNSNGKFRNNNNYEQGFNMIGAGQFQNLQLQGNSPNYSRDDNWNNSPPQESFQKYSGPINPVNQNKRQY
ncbi:unnamed protein product [Allacma fusca]|uniref:Uncharacterized protein n=1 Tax=Allacma fusca TaxID=39272 RepID=A0A8J2NVK8_9HEXA|nr:unnamed protein product [Allacma fusca]